jgi:hypothetical protein
MKLTKQKARELSKTITNDEIQQMLDTARNNITDWSKPSNSIIKASKGYAWNILGGNFDIKYEYTWDELYKLLLEYGEYIPAHLKQYYQPKEKVKKEKKLLHEEPIFNNSDNNDDYYKACMKLVNELLMLMHGPVCEICGTPFKNETYLMPVHILSVGSSKRMQFILKNIVWACHLCHKKWDEGTAEQQDKIEIKLQKIKNDPNLINNLKIMYNTIPLLKNQEVKDGLKQQIEKIKNFKKYEKKT